MDTHTQEQHETGQDCWTNPETTTPDVAPQPVTSDARHHWHGTHVWMLLLMCLPVFALGIWSFGSGANPAGLISGLMCMGMMAVMHLGMGGGKNHRG